MDIKLLTKHDEIQKLTDDSQHLNDPPPDGAKQLRAT